MGRVHCASGPPGRPEGREARAECGGNAAGMAAQCGLNIPRPTTGADRDRQGYYGLHGAPEVVTAAQDALRRAGRVRFNRKLSM